jgi:O-acetyl-ADP-ribose deacetylase (regulator of RNase III)
VINVPTKRHWKGKARMADIEAGLSALVNAIKEFGITSIAVPPLGCGNGGLNWSDVEPRIRGALEPLHGVRVMMYAPEGAPQPEKMPVATRTPSMTRVRATILLLLRRYGVPGYKLSLLEVQKLAYLLEQRGEPLKLEFVRHRFGPYSERLQHVLQSLEGHYIRGYGDRSSNASIRVTDEAVRDSLKALRAHPDSQQRLHDVANLIEGFETPYGMELLATVHWVAAKNPERVRNADDAVRAVHAWSERKRQMFSPKHIAIAWDRLVSHHWIGSPAN